MVFIIKSHHDPYFDKSFFSHVHMLCCFTYMYTLNYCCIDFVFRVCRKNLSELAKPFHSIYISFYKGLGAISGAMLLGNREFCEEARVWLTRFGGNLYTKMPYGRCYILCFLFYCPCVHFFLFRPILLNNGQSIIAIKTASRIVLDGIPKVRIPKESNPCTNHDIW